MSGRGGPTREVSPWAAGLGCHCPRCGAGPLYDGWLRIAPACTACGLDLTPHDSGDGPAVFVIFILGAVVVPAALLLEMWVAPPLWVHMAVWTPVIIGLSLLSLRVIKAILVAFHYKNLRHEYREPD